MSACGVATVFLPTDFKKMKMRSVEADFIAQGADSSAGMLRGKRDRASGGRQSLDIATNEPINASWRILRADPDGVEPGVAGSTRGTAHLGLGFFFFSHPIPMNAQG